MQSSIKQQVNRDSQTEQDSFICRSQMVTIARQYNIHVSRSTIHSWANQQGFPLVLGQNGHRLLYSKAEFVAFVKQKVRKIQEDH